MTANLLRRSFVAMATCLSGSLCWAGDHPFFVTYTTQMEEPGTLEIANKNAVGKPKGGNAFIGSLIEFEYGATAWWTTEAYLDAQSTRRESTTYTGFRWENRFRILRREHWITPVLYVEYENLNGADKTFLEVVGHDSFEDFGVPVSEARLETEREMEVKLLLTSYHSGWSISENLIAEKDMNAPTPWEFGYAVGAYRPLSLKPMPLNCTFCMESFLAGVEIYGGLGTRASFGLQNTSHYVAPTLAWDTGHGVLFKVSPNFGLTDTSAGFLMRFGVWTEIEQFGRQFQRLFR